MNLVNVNFFEIESNQQMIDKIPRKFTEKYNCMAYGYYDSRPLVLVNDNFSFYDFSKIGFYINEQFYISRVDKENWESIYQLSKLSSNRNDAVFKYQIDKTDDFEVSIKEDVKKFYNVEVENSPIVVMVNTLLNEALEMKASDIHLEPTKNNIIVRFRIDGKLVVRPSYPIDFLDELSTRIKVLSDLDITKKYQPQDGKIKYEYKNNHIDIRVSILPTIFGERFALRLLDTSEECLTIEQIGFSEKDLKTVYDLVDSSNGMILIVGPTGSGKSTTLHSFLLKNVERNVNIITVEDPVEYTIPGVNQVQVNNEAGLTFAACLRSILRQDPNIIMIGEIRDFETAEIACRASITGHLVYSTLHSNTSIGVFNRLIDMNIESYLLVDSIKGIISQRLVRVLCDNCKKKYVANEIEKAFLRTSEDVEIYRSIGCGKCHMTGYLGRRAVYEILKIDDDFKSLISDHASNLKYMKLMEKKGITTLFDSTIKLILEGVTSIEEGKSILN